MLKCSLYIQMYECFIFDQTLAFECSLFSRKQLKFGLMIGFPRNQISLGTFRKWSNSKCKYLSTNNLCKHSHKIIN